jgi:hypothetical protein
MAHILQKIFNLISPIFLHGFVVTKVVKKTGSKTEGKKKRKKGGPAPYITL